MLIFALILTLLMLVVLVTDITRYIIPNRLVLVVLAIYPIMVWMTPHRPDWQTALIVMACVFAVGFVLFAIHAMGGGDIKLVTALALWVGKKYLFQYLFLVAIIGGVFSILLWLSRIIIDKIIARYDPKPVLMRVLTKGAPVPYGVALALAFMLFVWTNKIPGIVL